MKCVFVHKSMHKSCLALITILHDFIINIYKDPFSNKWKRAPRYDSSCEMAHFLRYSMQAPKHRDRLEYRQTGGCELLLHSIQEGKGELGPNRASTIDLFSPGSEHLFCFDHGAKSIFKNRLFLRFGNSHLCFYSAFRI